MDVKKLNTKPKFDRFKERRLSASNSGPKTEDTAREQDDKITELSNNFIKVQNKAKTIRAEARRLAIVRRVPVDPRAQDVVGAVQRQDPTSSGAFITFELYERSLSYINRQRESLPPSILDDISGDPVSDSHKIHTRLLQEVEDIGLDEAELLGSQILILVVLKLLQMGLDNLDAGKQTGTKQPSGSELASIAAGIAVSVAAQQAYAAINARHIEKSLKEVSDKVPLDKAAVDRAKSDLQNSELFQAAIKSKRPSDYAIIIQYVDAFLNKQTEPGWETWQAIGLLDESISWNNSIIAQTQAMQRSQPLPATETETGRPGILDPLLTQSIAIQNTQTNNPNQFDPTVFDVYNRNLDSINRTVDKIGHVLGHALSAKDICCFLRWLEVQDKETVKSLRSILEIAQNALTTLDNYGAANQFRANLTVSAAVHQSVMMLMHDLERGLLKKINNWFLTETDKWEELMKCGLIDDLYTHIVGAIDTVQQKLATLLERYLGFIEDQESRMDISIDTMGQQAQLRSLMGIIDMFLDFTGPVSGTCSDPDPERLAQSVARVISGLGPTISVPLEGSDPYSTVASQPVKLSTGKEIPANNTNIPTEAEIDEASRAVCRDGNVDMNLVPFPR